ncbi:MAG: DUF308 domain-containing protein [Bacteroidales bacterium]
MKNPFHVFNDRRYIFLRAFFALLLGLALIIWPEIAQDTLVIIIGTIILLIGIISIIIAYSNKTQINTLVAINGIVDILFGIVLVLFPTFFAGLLMFLFGAMLIFFGIMSLIELIRANKLIKVSNFLWLGPILTLIFGIVLFINPFKSAKWLIIFFGIGIILYSLTEFYTAIKTRKINSQYTDAEILADETSEETKV